MNKKNKNITKKNINQKNKNINEKNMNKENKGGKNCIQNVFVVACNRVLKYSYNPNTLLLITVYCIQTSFIVVCHHVLTYIYNPNTLLLITVHHTNKQRSGNA